MWKVLHQNYSFFFAISTVFCFFSGNLWTCYLLLIFLLHYYTCLLFCNLYACKLAATACHYLGTWTQSSFLRLFVHALTSVRCWIKIECFNNADLTETGQVEHAHVTIMNNLRWEPLIIPYHRHLINKIERMQNLLHFIHISQEYLFFVTVESYKHLHSAEQCPDQNISVLPQSL